MCGIRNRSHSPRTATLRVKLNFDSCPISPAGPPHGTFIGDGIGYLAADIVYPAFREDSEVTREGKLEYRIEIGSALRHTNGFTG